MVLSANQMAEEFLILYDKITNFDAPGYNDNEISVFLNKAQERLVFQYYNQRANSSNEGFEGTEKRRKELSNLVKDVTVIPEPHDSDFNYPNGVFVEVPEEFMFTIAEDCLISLTSCVDNGLPVESTETRKRVRIYPVTHDMYVRNINNPWKKPYNNLVWRMDYSQDSDTTYYPFRHELITDGTYTVVSYHARYLKRPRSIVVDRTNVANAIDSELNPIILEGIIDEAVKIAVSVTKPEEYQIKTIETQESK